MITAVDTNILLDVFGPDPEFGTGSGNALRACLSEGSVVACEIVWAETVAWFPSSESAQETLDGLGIAFSPLDRSTAAGAGLAWRAYRRRGDRRARVIADFLIGAHAASQSDRLLTRDRGFYKKAFKRLEVVDPTVLR